MAAYATISDMQDRFGLKELIYASTPDGAEAVGIVPGPIEAALADATAIIDSFLRKRYRTPLSVAPQEIVSATCVLARYTLSTGGGRMPSDQVKDDRAEKMAWLAKVASGLVVLDVQEVAPGGESFAQTQSRPAVFGDRGYGFGVPFDDYCGGGFP